MRRTAQSTITPGASRLTRHTRIPAAAAAERRILNTAHHYRAFLRRA